MISDGETHTPDPVRVLLVDDTDLEAEYIERSLQRTDIPTTITRARNGLEALACIDGSDDQPPLVEPYVILLDLNMPRMNGVEFLQAMVTRPNASLPPVLVMTSSSRASDYDAVLQYPNCQYSVKPVGRGVLAAFVAASKTQSS